VWRILTFLIFFQQCNFPVCILPGVKIILIYETLPFDFIKKLEQAFLRDSSTRVFERKQIVDCVTADEFMLRNSMSG
jgi:hypothetical protein